jgi:hypothetical protein
MDTVKYQFFSEKNNNFIIDMLKKKGNVDVLNKNTVFQIQNNIFNAFLESVYNKDISVTNSNIEEILISLNKMTMIQCEKNAAASPLAVSSPLASSSPVLKPSLPVASLPAVPTTRDPTTTTEPTTTTKTTSTQTQTRTLLKNSQVQTEQIKQSHSLLHVFSDDPVVKYDKLKLKSFRLHFNLYNINENNNLLEIKMDMITTKIYLPIGHYDLKNLLYTIETSITSKISSGHFKLVYDQIRNRIKISNSTHFNLHFIDSPKAILNLRTILGFANTEYMNNNHYIAENEHKLDFFNTIYVRSDMCEPNIHTSSGFDYLFKLNFDSSKHQSFQFDFDCCDLVLKEHKIAFQFYIYVKEFKQINQSLEYDAIFSVGS